MHNHVTDSDQSIVGTYVNSFLFICLTQVLALSVDIARDATDVENTINQVSFVCLMIIICESFPLTFKVLVILFNFFSFFNFPFKYL